MSLRIKFTLVIQPDGRAILMVPSVLSSEELEDIKKAWDEWRAKPANDALLMMPGEVVRIEQITLEV